MLRVFLFSAAALVASSAIAADCPYTWDGRSLYFVTPGLIAVQNLPGMPPYACSTHSAGTGVNGMMIECTDGYAGSLSWGDDEATTVTFRGETWNNSCPDNTAMDIGMGN